MSVVFTAVFRVQDWQALRRLSDVTLITYARAAGARRYRLYRNTHDAAEALLLVEGVSALGLAPLHNALRQLIGRAAPQSMSASVRDMPDGQIWEQAECLMIGEDPLAH
jgi:hypothetical protein